MVRRGREAASRPRTTGKRRQARPWRRGAHPSPGRRGPRERGSVAVEFALLMPLLLLIVCGIIDFGRALNAEITLTQAAREGVRLESVATATSTVQSDTESAATGLSLTSSNVCVGGASPATSCTGSTGTDLCTSTSSTTSNAEVTVAYSFSFITPVGYLADWFTHGSFNNSITLSATGVEPCESLGGCRHGRTVA